MNYDKAENITNIIIKKYSNKEWFCSVGIKYENDIGFYVSIRVEKGFEPDLPQIIDGVMIKMEKRNKAQMYLEGV